MMINGMWNRRFGPGGGTRRLHQIIQELCRALALWGRNRIDVRNKDISFIRHCTVVIGLFKISANRNRFTGVKAVANQAATTLVEGVKKVSAANFFGNFAVNAANGPMLVAQAA